jgi:hypothetical protein
MIDVARRGRLVVLVVERAREQHGVDHDKLHSEVVGRWCVDTNDWLNV